jgi:hypothetical protein
VDAQPGKHVLFNKEFALKEYECLRQEIIWLLKDYRALERNVVIAVGLSWAWLFEHKCSPRFAWFIPVLFVALGALRASGIFKQFGVFHCYVKRIESAFGADLILEGWEHFSWQKTGWVSKSAIALWLILAFSCLGIGRYEFMRPLSQCESSAATRVIS